VSPSSNSQIDIHVPLTLQATAFDRQETLPDAQFSWTSDRDGFVGTGRELTVANLTVGRHTLTVTVVDSRGLTGRDSVQIEVDATSAPSCAGVTFAETGKCLQGRFLTYWHAHGGLAVNGFPLSNEFTEVLEDGKPYTVQYFERVRMEYHPENQPPYDVLLGQFGRRLHPADPPVAAQPGMTYFDVTGHNVIPQFMAYWNTNGGLPQFGYPLSELITETLEDGKSYQVQYFERARFELHPENPPPYDVLLGQFGRRILGGR